MYILYTASISLEKRARVDSCQRTIIVFECNNFTRNNNDNNNNNGYTNNSNTTTNDKLYNSVHLNYCIYTLSTTLYG